MPILTDIENGMSSLISAMTVGNYNFNWNSESVNQPDLAKVQFPTAVIMLESEDCLDEPDGAFSDGYMQEAIYQIIVKARLDDEEDLPLWAINAELNKALDDLKKLFGVNYSVSGSCDIVMYVGMTREIEASGDRFVPKRMITRWRVRYTQDRRNPETVAE